MRYCIAALLILASLSSAADQQGTCEETGDSCPDPGVQSNSTQPNSTQPGLREPEEPRAEQHDAIDEASLQPLQRVSFPSGNAVASITGAE
jgi:hypothetical protein